jgi:hypothetical protein
MLYFLNCLYLYFNYVNSLELVRAYVVLMLYVD